MIYLIPARAGSKRLPGKNRMLFWGLPLWMWSAATAQRVRHRSDRIVVSTDDHEIAAQAMTLGLEVHQRPPELAQDETPSIDVVQAVMSAYGEDVVCLLQPTSPNRRDTDVRKAVLLSYSGKHSVVGIHGHQQHSGAVYVYRKDCMPDQGWTNAQTIRAPSCDIDTLEDWMMAQHYGTIGEGF